MTWGRDSSASVAWRRLDSETREHAETRAEVARLRAALEHIATGEAGAVAVYARRVLEGGKP